MTSIEVALSVGSVAIAISSIFYVKHIVRTGGRDRPRDPEAVRRFVDRAEKIPVIHEEKQQP